MSTVFAYVVLTTVSYVVGALSWPSVKRWIQGEEVTLKREITDAQKKLADFIAQKKWG